MSKRLIDFDPLSGVSTFHHYDEMTDKTVIQTVQDITPFLERNKRLQNDEDYSRQGMKNEMWHAATIPIGVQEKWLAEEGIDVYNKNHWPAVKRKLNDKDYLYLRTSLGRI